MNLRDSMVIYDQRPYMTMFGVLDGVFGALPEGNQIDGLLFEKSRDELTIWQESAWNVGTLEYWNIGLKIRIGLVLNLN